MQTCALAVDIGASSGRHIVGTVENGRMALHEVYRFENRLVEKKRAPVLGPGGTVEQRARRPARLQSRRLRARHHGHRHLGR